MDWKAGWKTGRPILKMKYLFNKCLWCSLTLEVEIFTDFKRGAIFYYTENKYTVYALLIRIKHLDIKVFVGDVGSKWFVNCSLSKQRRPLFFS